MLFVALCCFFVMANGVLGAAQAEDRTNGNDNQSLLGIVVQLQAKVLSMENEAEKMKGKLRRVKVQQEQTQADLATLQASLHKQAAFSVTFDHVVQGRLNMGTGGIIRFDKIVTNIAGGYNVGTGIFTAPYAGVYAFSCSIRSINDRDWVSVSITKGDTQLAIATADGKIDHWDKGSAFATTYLDKGDQVFVKHYGGDTYVERGVLTTFSGMLVTAD
uniref:Type 2 C1q domain-containing protein 3 n=1 Tax=Littorina littorea TaxID=31216 RepID=A0A411DEP3_LITLI|nr:type 2 C1q domain-containing protein 3 [Littorina littorea]